VNAPRDLRPPGAALGEIAKDEGTEHNAQQPETYHPRRFIGVQVEDALNDTEYTADNVDFKCIEQPANAQNGCHHCVKLAPMQDIQPTRDIGGDLLLCHSLILSL
jgi:hypothetical protein